MPSLLSSLNTARPIDAALERVLEGAVARLQSGERVDLNQLAAAHPEHTSAIRELLPAIEMLIGMGAAGADVTAQLGSDMPSVVATNGAAPPPYRQLGDFRIIRELGRGGMGTVFEAEQLSMGRRVALKVLPFAALAHEKSLQRFRNEVRAAAALDHPNIVSVYSVGEERGVHYYAMQLIRGQTLAELIDGLRVKNPSPSQGREQPSTGDPKSPERRAVGIVAERPGGTRDARPAAGAHPANGAVVGNPSPVRNPPPSKGGARGGANDAQPRTGVRNDDDAAFENPSPVPSLPGRGAGNDAPTIDSAVSAPPSTAPVEQARVSTAIDSRRAAERFRTAARLGIQAAEALQHAHDVGVLHRDIKPGNLMVDLDGDLYITDFGLARIQSDAGMTMTGDIVGTLRYMAPEQALAKRVVIDHRADVYSLGATLYELLTLQPAFAETDRSALLKQIAFEEPRPLRKVDHRIPADFETIVLKAMAKNPDERYQSAQVLAADLQAVLEHRAIKAKPPTVIQRLSKFSRRHSKALLAGAATLLVLAVGSLIFSGRLILEQRRTQQAAAESKAVIDFLVNELLGAPVDELKSEKEVTVVDVLDNAEAKVSGAFAAQPLVEATVRHVMGMTYFKLGKYAEAEPHLRRASELRTTLLGPANHETIESRANLGYTLMNLCRPDEAGIVHDEVLDSARSILGSEHPDTMRAMTDVAVNIMQCRGVNPFLRGMGGSPYNAAAIQYVEAMTASGLPIAVKLLEECLRASQRVLGDEHEDTLNATQLLATVYANREEWDKAHALNAKALTTSRRVLGIDHKLTLIVEWNLLQLYLKKGRHQEGIPLAEKYLATMRRIRGARAPRVLEHTLRIAQMLQSIEREKEARELFEVGFRDSQEQFGMKHLMTQEFLAGLGDVGGLAEREQATRKLIAITPDSTFVQPYRALAWVLAKQGKIADARDVLDEMIRFDPADPYLHAYAAECLAMHGESTAAEAACREAMRLQPKEVPNLFDLARALALIGKNADARRAIDAALKIDPHCMDDHSRAGDFWVRLNELDKAAEQYRLAFSENSDDLAAGLRAAVLSIALEDPDAYESICRQMLSRNQETKSLGAAQRICAACLLSPNPVGDVNELVRLADIAVREKWDIHLATKERGLAAYRRGEFEDAIKWCSESRAAGTSLRFQAYNNLIISMALHKLGRNAEATSTYNLAVSQIQDAYPYEPPMSDTAMPWIDWLAFDVLRREASSLLQVE